MVPAYTEISHFRAPYKNAYIAGFGQAAPALAVPPLAPPPPPGGLAEGAVVTTDERGYRFIKPEVRTLVIEALKRYSTTFLGGPFNNVKLTPFTSEQISASQTDPAAKAFMDSVSAFNWIKQQESANNVVFMSMPTLVAIMSGQVLPPGADMLGTFPVGSNEAKEAAKSPLGVVAAGDPEGKSMLAGFGPFGIALIAAAAVGGIWYLAKKSRDRRRTA